MKIGFLRAGVSSSFDTRFRKSETFNGSRRVFAARCLISENFSIKLGLERLRFNFVSDHSKLCHLRSTIKPLKYL